MNDRKEDLDRIVDKHLGLFDSPPPQDVAGSRERILDRLRSRAANGTRPAAVHSTNWKWRLSAAAAAAAATLVLFAVLTQWHANRNAVYAVVEDAGGGIYRVEGGEALRSGERIEANETVRTNGGVGTVLKLADGSVIEMRSKSELFLEHAVDGVRIRLSHGSVIVNAAPQRTGHLYVRTKEMTVSVVGTVFFVNAEEEGSRVAVIEGEVRVKQGETESTLKPGEQMSTNPSIPALPVKEEVGWSRNAPEHIALLLQSAIAVPRDAFELASIRPTAFSHDEGARGAGGNAGRRSGRPYDDPCTDAGPFFLKFDPSRVDITDVPVYGLIGWAQSIECKPRYGSDFLIGGPNWIRTDGYDIHANIPPGPPAYTEGRDFSMGAGRTMKEQIMTARFRNMLQTLLTERFQLVLRKEIREMPIFVLTPARSGAKLTPWKEGDALCLGNGDCRRTGASDQGPESLSGQKQTMTSLAQQLEGLLGRTVVDRTGITGEYNYAVSFDWVVNLAFGPPRPPAGSPRSPGSPPPSDQSLFDALEQTLGLKLEATKMPMEVTVIERVERPSEN